jgi:hypothetical protein
VAEQNHCHIHQNINTSEMADKSNKGGWASMVKTISTCSGHPVSRFAFWLGVGAAALYGSLYFLQAKLLFVCSLIIWR